MNNILENDLCDLADFFKIFGDSTRLKIMIFLKDGEKNVDEISNNLNMTQSAISHQLKSLKLNKLVKSRKDGKMKYYSLDDSHIENIINIGFEHLKEK